jgi:hypothetical protein
LKNYFAECFTLALDKEAFAECFFWHSARAVYRTLGKAFFAECRGFCRVFFIWLSAKPSLPSARKKRSAKPPALDKEADSGSIVNFGSSYDMVL